MSEAKTAKEAWDELEDAGVYCPDCVDFKFCEPCPEHYRTPCDCFERKEK